MPTATCPEMNVDDHRIDWIEDANMTEFKSALSVDYEVNAELVAQEIIRKLRLVKFARRELLGVPDPISPGRTPGRSVRGL
jgi:hypothetical protein